MKIAILTGGGDAPGLNPVIRSVVKVAKENQVEMIGIKKGWAGLVELNHFYVLLLEFFQIHETFLVHKHFLRRLYILFLSLQD